MRKTTISDYLKHLAAFMLQVHNTDPDHVSALRFVFALNRALMSFIDMLHVYKKTAIVLPVTNINMFHIACL